MTELAVVTPSFGPDAELFADLHRSVLRYTSERTVHHAIVPDADRRVFARFEGPRCQVWLESELLPRRFRRLPRGYWLNARRPWPPVRGWVLQQALKIAATAAIEADAVLIADSDIVLVRPTGLPRFMVDGRMCLYRDDGAVHAGMTRHVLWHAAARHLLGLPPAPPPPLPDYVSSLNIWQPSVVRAMQARISESTGRDWLDAFSSQLHISEFILYGVFVDQLAGTEAPWPTLDRDFCHNYWDREPLTPAGAEAFADRLPPDAIGMMISAKSRTPLPARHAAVRRCAELARS